MPDHPSSSMSFWDCWHFPLIWSWNLWQHIPVTHLSGVFLGFDLHYCLYLSAKIAYRLTISFPEHTSWICFQTAQKHPSGEVDVPFWGYDICNHFDLKISWDAGLRITAVNGESDSFKCRWSQESIFSSLMSERLTLRLVINLVDLSLKTKVKGRVYSLISSLKTHQLTFHSTPLVTEPAGNWISSFVCHINST